MKNVKIVLDLIIIPCGTLLFIMVGLFAAIISALIEYTVFRELFSSAYHEFIPSGAIALLLVGCLEYAKVYLHFLQNKIKSSSTIATEHTMLIKWIPNLIRFLVAISLTCNIFFTVTTLYMPNYNEESVSIQIATIDTKLKSDKENVTQQYDDILAQKMTPFSKSKTAAEDALTNFDPSGYGPKALTSIYAGFNANITAANKEYTTALETYTLERTIGIQQECDALEQKATEEKEQLLDTSSPELAMTYDNKILSHFLVVIAETFFNKTSYSRSSYLCLCILISIVLSVVLEVLIAISSSFISIPIDQLADEPKGISTKIHTWCNEFVLTLFKTFCAVAIYIVILSFHYATLGKDEIYIGLLSCMISIYLTNKFILTPSGNNTSPKAFLYYQIRDCVLQGIVSFMGYILLGFIFGKDSATLDINTVAVAIGSTLSGGMGRLPHFLSSELFSSKSEYTSQGD